MDQVQKREGHAFSCDNRFPNGRNSQSHSAPGTAADHSAAVQSHYPKPSHLNILSSFGLSSEGLEELSHYPNNQLTSENMPLLLEAIQKHRLAPKVPTLPSEVREKETISAASGLGPTVKKKVIDYGHKSKYEYNEAPIKVNASSIATDDSMKGFQTQQPASARAAPSSVVSNPKNPTKKVTRQVGAQTSTPNLQAFSSVDSSKKVPLAEPEVPATAPPVMLPMVLSMSQLVMPPGVPRIFMPAETQRPPPFAPEMVEMAGQGRPEHTSRADPPNRLCQTTDGQKSFRKKAEEPVKSPFGVVKASWLPDFSQMDKQKVKKLPTPSEMNDYFAVTPRIFPHICSLCDEGCMDKMDWIQHQNSLLHNKKCHWLLQQHPDWTPETPSSTKRQEGDRQERHKSRQRSGSPSPKRSKHSSSGHDRHWTRSRSRSCGRHSPKCSRHSSSGHDRHWTRSRSRSCGRHRTSQPRTRSPRHLPSPRHRSRSPRQSLHSSGRSQNSSNKERGSGSSTRSTEGSCARTPFSKIRYDEWTRTHNILHRQEKGREDLEQTREVTPHHKLPVDKTRMQKQKHDKLVPERRSCEKPEPSALASLTEKSILQAMAQLHSQGAADRTLSQGGDSAQLAATATDTSAGSSNLVSMIQQVTTQVIMAVLDSKEASAMQTSRGVRNRNPQQDNSLTRKAKSAVGPSSPQGTAKSTKAECKSRGSPGPKKDTSLSSKAKNKPVEGQSAKKSTSLSGRTKDEPKADLCPKKNSSLSDKTKNKPKAGLCPKKGTSSCSKAKNKCMDSPRVHQGSAERAKRENQHLADQRPEQGIASSVKAANDSMVDLSPHQGTSAGSKRENKDVVGACSQQGIVPKSRGSRERMLELVPGSIYPCSGAPESLQSTEAGDSIIKEAEETCVVVISNLPEVGFSVDQICTLTKPFGRLKDVLILSSHKKAYLEISQKSVDSLVKFYSCFPMFVETNKLCISVASEFKDIKDEEAIFIAEIKDADPKVNVEALHAQFVHLGNLPEGGYSELEILCIGLRFGRVDHYMVIENKKKAILQLNSAESAASMCRFLERHPYRLRESQLTFSRSPKIKLLQDEVPRKKVRKQGPSKKSPDLKKIPKGSGLVQTASVPSSKPTGAKEEPSSKRKVVTAEVKTEPSQKMKCEGPSGPAKTAKADNSKDCKGRASVTKVAKLSSSEVKAEKALALASSLRKEEKVTEKFSSELLGNAPTCAAGDKDEELAGPASELSEASKGAIGVGEKGGSPAKKEERVETVPLGSAEAPVEELSREDLQSQTKLTSPGTDHTDACRNLPGMSAPEVGVMVDKEPEKPSSTTEGGSMEVAAEMALPETTEAAKEKPELQTCKAETASEKQAEVLVSKDKPALEEKGEKKAGDEGPKQSLPKSQPSKEMGEGRPEESSKPDVLATESELCAEATSASKPVVKTLMSVPDISKKRTVAQRKEEQKLTVKPGTRSSTAAEKKPVSKEASQQRLTSTRSNLPDSKSKVKLSSLVVKVGSGKDSSQEEKDSHVDTKGSSKRTQAQEARSSTVKRDGNKEKVFAGRNTRSSTRSTKPKQEEDCFPFNLDEFVTVDEVTDEVESPSQPKRNPPRGKRKDVAHPQPSSKRRKGKTSVANGAAEQELSFVTLDEVREDEGGMAQVAECLEAMPTPQVLVTVDELKDEEELISRVSRDTQSFVTLDEISSQERSAIQETLKEADGEPCHKAEPLVTVDEIGEVEELPLDEPLHLKTETSNDRREEKQVLEDAGGLLSSQVPKDPSTLVTVDEIHKDSEDQPPVTLDEVTEEDDDFLDGDLNFVTVDEVGSEDEEEEKVTIRSTSLEEMVAARVSEKETAMAIAEPAEGLLLATKQKETVIPEDATPEGKACSGENFPEEDKASETQVGTGEKESVAAETGMQEAVETAVETEKSETAVETEKSETAVETEKSETAVETAVETEKSESGKDLEETLKEGTEVEAQCEPPVADSTSNLTDQPDNQGSDREDTQQPSELESHEEDVEAKAIEMDVDRGSEEPVADKEQKGDVAVPASAPEVSVGGQETAGGEDPEAGSEPLGQDPGGEEESCTEMTPSQSSEKPEEDLDSVVPTGGFFCLDEAAMKSHCQSALHQRNEEKFVNKKPEEEKRNEDDGDPPRESSSPDLKKIPKGSGLVQTASVPSSKPTEAKEEPSSKRKVVTAEVKTEPSQKTECEGPSGPAKTSGLEDKLAASITNAAELSSSEVKAEKALALASGLGKEEKVTDESSSELLGNAPTCAAGDKDEELAGPASELSEASKDAIGVGEKGGSPPKKEEGVETAPAVGETVPLGSAEAPVEELSREDLQSDTKPASPGTDHTDACRNLPGMSAPEVGVMVDKEPEKHSSTTEGGSMEVAAETALPETTEAAKEKPELQTCKAEAEKQPEVLVSEDKPALEEKGEKKAGDEGPKQSLPKSQPSKEMGEESSKADVLATESELCAEATSASKPVVKTLTSVPDISKKRTVSQRKEEQKLTVKPGTRSSTAAEKKPVSKEASQQRLTSTRSNLPDSKSKVKLSSLVVKVGSGKDSSQEEKDSHVETKGSSKRTQAQEARSSTVKRDSNKEKVFVGRNTRSSTRSTKPKEDEELFPFNLDEFVTVDEVTDEVESPSQPKRNPPRGKRKDAAHEPSSKRRKSKSSVAHGAAEQALSFVTLDEVREDEGGMAQAAEHLEAMLDPQVLVTVDELNTEEELISEVPRDPQPLVTLDEISDQEDPPAHEAVKEADGEADLKALVTVDEIGEAKELPLNKPSHLKTETLNDRREEKQVLEDAGGLLSSQLPEDPSTLVMVDEIHEDSEDQPLVTLDEVTEEDDDFLDGDLNFVTVDEVGSEDEEEEKLTVTSTSLEELMGSTVPEAETAAAIVEPAEGLLSAAKREETVIPEDAAPGEKVCTGEDFPEEKKAPETLGGAAEKEGVAEETGTQEATFVEPEQSETEQGEGGKGLEETLKEEEEEAQCKPPVADSTLNLTDQPDKQGSDREDTPQPSELESHEEDVEAKAIEMDVDRGSEEPVAHQEQKGDVAVPASAPEVSVGGQEAAGGEDPEAGSEPLGQDPGGEEESCTEMTPSQSSEKPEEELAVSECEGPESEQKTVDSSEKSKAPDDMEDLDFLVPKAGFLCQICSCFCVDEAAMKSHCQSAVHQQNKEKFMNRKAEEEEGKEGDGDAARESSR